MNYALDITTDFSLAELNSFLDRNTLPEFVKVGEVLSKEAIDSLQSDAFADRYHRAYPIESPANVYVSNAYFINKKAALEDKWGKNYVTEVEDRIAKAAELFNITEDLANYNSQLNEKTAADYTEQAVSTITQDGRSFELFPYKTAEDVSYQAEAFAHNVKDYPFAWRSKIASDFITAATELGIDELPNIICKYAGQYFPDTRNFKTELNRRMNKISSEQAKEQYTELLKHADIASRDEAMEVCNKAYTIEKSAGVYDNNALYTSLGDIIDRTFTLNIDKIAALLDVVKMAGDTYAMDDLKKISAEVYKQACGCDLDPTKEAELREVLPTLPMSDVALLRELSGISPL